MTTIWESRCDFFFILLMAISFTVLLFWKNVLILNVFGGIMVAECCFIIYILASTFFKKKKEELVIETDSITIV